MISLVLTLNHHIVVNEMGNQFHKDKNLKKSKGNLRNNDNQFLKEALKKKYKHG